MTTTERRIASMTWNEIGIAALLVALFVLLAGVPGGQNRLDGAQAEIDLALGRAQALARGTGVPHGVGFDVLTDRYAVVDAHGQVAARPDTGRDDAGPIDPEGEVDLLTATFGPGGSTAIFDGTGVPLSAGSLILRSGAEERLLVVDPATGLITIP